MPVFPAIRAALDPFQYMGFLKAQNNIIYFYCKIHTLLKQDYILTAANCKDVLDRVRDSINSHLTQSIPISVVPTTTLMVWSVEIKG